MVGIEIWLGLLGRSVRRMEVKDWITLIFSFSAIVVSLASVYITTFRRIDDFRVALPYTFDANVDREKSETTITGSIDVVLVNNGNRSVAVTNAGIGVIESDNIKNNECVGEGSGSGSFRYYEFDPFVVKTGEVIVRRFTVPEDKQTNEKIWHVGFAPDVTNPKKRKFTFCFVAGFITPERAFSNKVVPVWAQIIDYSQPVRLGTYNKPYPLNLRETKVLLPASGHNEFPD
jgi:hypothetical protein